MTTSPRPGLDALVERSRALIAALQTGNGAYPASPDFSAYRGYCWLRDGAFIADGMSAVGEVASATAFFDWCADTVHRHEPTIDAAVRAAADGTVLPDELMPRARFTLDGDLGADEWWDFQLDGYGTWLWALAEHTRRHGLAVDPWRRAAATTVDYLLSSWRRPCYDWWEEHNERVHVSTLGCVGAGLHAAAAHGLVDGARAVAATATAGRIRELIETEGAADGHLVKWLGTTEVDASLAALIAPLGFLPADTALARGTVAAIEADLAVGRGVHRFLADTFYGGGQWPLLSCFVGLARAAMGEAEAARGYLDWAAGTATPQGMLPEQVDDHLLDPSRHAEWVERWGTVATPLLWSHAMVLRLAAELEDA